MTYGVLMINGKTVERPAFYSHRVKYAPDVFKKIPSAADLLLNRPYNPFGIIWEMGDAYDFVTRRTNTPLVLRRAKTLTPQATDKAVFLFFS